MDKNLVQNDARLLCDELPHVGPLALGLWRYTNTDIGHATNLLEAAIDLGINLVDNADVYGLDWGGNGFGACEELLGQVLSGSPKLRDQIVLATKGGIQPPVPYNSSSEYLRKACEDSLRRMNVEQIDLYLVHRPDIYTHPAEVAATLDSLVEEEKVIALGVSNYSPGQIKALQEHLRTPLIAVQPEFSAVHLNPLRDGILDLAAERDLVPLAWSPLAGGSLATGEGIPTELAAVLDDLASRESVDRATIAIAFVLSHPTSPIAILGTQTIERLEKLSEALKVSLTRADVYKIIQASEGVPLP